MTLRFEVNQAEALRRGVSVPKSTCHIEVDPSKLSQQDRNLIADRLEGIDVCRLDEHGMKQTLHDGNGPTRVVANLPTFDALMEAVRANQHSAIMRFTVEPLHNSDWREIHTAQVVGTKMEVIHCKAGPGVKLPPVQGGRHYVYRGNYPFTFTAPGDTTAQGMPLFTVYAVQEGNECSAIQGTLTNKTGMPIASGSARLWANLTCGDFHLPSSANVELVLNGASAFLTEDGKRLELSNVRRCNAVHPLSPPGQIHIEFDFKAAE